MAGWFLGKDLVFSSMVHGSCSSHSSKIPIPRVASLLIDNLAYTQAMKAHMQ